MSLHVVGRGCVGALYSEYNLFILTLVNGKQEDDSEVQQVTIRGTKHGLGIRIVGGKTVSSAEESGFGIFIKEVIKGSLAARDGKT